MRARRAERGGDLGRVCDVERDDEQLRRGVFLRERGEDRGRAQRRDRALPRGEDLLEKGSPQALGAARDWSRAVSASATAFRLGMLWNLLNHTRVLEKLSEDI